jgi:capsular polysaccharide biosynthesis protein
VNDPDRKITLPNGNGIGDYLPEGLWDLSDFTTVEEQSSAADVTGGLASLGFITAALRRRARLWSTIAVAGLLLGCGLYLKSPPAYQASTSLLLTPGPYENINTAANNDQAMAQSATVAGLAVRKLGLWQSAGSFLGTYKVTPVTERVLLITASARSSSQAVLDASAVASAFLQFRAQEMQTEQKLVLASLNQQVNQAQQHLDSIDSQISQLSAQLSSSAQQSQLKSLRTQRTQANVLLSNLQQAALDNQAGVQPATAAAIKGSVVLDAAAPLVHSRLKPLVLRVAIGLILGLALGMAIVVVQALVSDRLRRRDDVAQALGAPVKLSVGAGRLKRWLPGRRGASARDADVQRIAAHLGRAVPRNSRGIAALAIVSVDDLQVPASSLVSLAVSCAGEGRQVVVADLCSGAPAARLLGAEDPGVHTVSAHDTSLVVAVPERDDMVPVGPLDRGSAQAQRSTFTEAVVAACASADLLLTLATLDPALGGEHLATWATDAVAVVTAGRSSWTKIHGVGELVRLSGTRLVSAVLAGADDTDESLGMIPTPETA